MSSETISERFKAYFAREVAENAARSLSNGAEIEFQVTLLEGDQTRREIFTFTRREGRNHVLASPARNPQLLFLMHEKAAEAILSDPAEDIGSIGVNIMKQVVSSDPELRISVHFRAGFLSLFTQGYFGVLSAGGSQVAAYLASRGLNGMGAIKAALKKIT